jgi:hypothetical protein
MRSRFGLALPFTLALAVLGSFPSHAEVSGEWRVNLLRGSTTVSALVGETQEEAWTKCEKAIPEIAENRTQYTCEKPRFVAVVTPEPVPPTCTAPKPADQSREQPCPTGTLGSWQQARTYAEAAFPGCWVAFDWLPASAPPGSCGPVMPGPSLYFDDFASGYRAADANGAGWLGRGKGVSIVP